jgi:hypothetical protein
MLISLLWLNNVGDGARYDGSFYGRGAGTPAFAAIGTCEPRDVGHPRFTA